MQHRKGEYDMFLFCYYFAGAMLNTEHDANDDCAICRAWSQKHAVRKFRNMYPLVDVASVFRVKYNSYGIAVLSDF